MNLSDHELLIFDGAMGTNLQALDLPDSVWQGNDGCNEFLNLTCPEAITELHGRFLDAGAMVLETNTFGATRTVLAEYGLEDDVDRINHAAVANAKNAIGSRENCYVAGSVGPTTKLVSLGHITVDELGKALKEQMVALVDAGVDALIIETCQDLLQVKTAVVACFEVLAEKGKQLPVMVSVTVEQTGTMLVGTDIAAATVTLEPFPIFSLGLNCATGPADMVSKIRHLSKQWPKRISCIPNQGLPEIVDGETVYPLSPEDYAQYMKTFVLDYGVSIVGGCCGTTPEHIRCLAKTLKGVTPLSLAARSKDSA